jgi:glutathione peroxidase
MASSVYEFKAKDITGQEQTLSSYQDKVLLIVNVASQCGFTYQYKGLEEVYEKYKDRGLVVLGFPCNQFGSQEPGDEKEIASFCSLKYDVKFPLFAKIDVNGKNEHPLYAYLKEERPGLLGTEAIKWNFTKFLIDRKGQPIKRFAPRDEPAALSSEIEKLL